MASEKCFLEFFSESRDTPFRTSLVESAFVIEV